MKLLERLDTDLKTAMKARDELGLRVLRMVKSDLRYKQIEVGHELSEDEVVAVVACELEVFAQHDGAGGHAATMLTNFVKPPRRVARVGPAGAELPV